MRAMSPGSAGESDLVSLFVTPPHYEATPVARRGLTPRVTLTKGDRAVP